MILDVIILYPKLVIGMRFKDGTQATKAIKEHVIEDGRNIQCRRVTKNQMEAYCNKLAN